MTKRIKHAMTPFLDVNVWLPLIWDGHVAREAAHRWAASTNEDLVLCRVTQLALLRHITNPTIMGNDTLTNSDAADLIQCLNSRAGVVFTQDPPGMDSYFPSLGESESPSRNRWTDAYLAAFAIAGNHQLISFDRIFTRYEAHGLKWQLLAVT